MWDFHISNFYILVSIFQIREGHYLFSFHSSQIPSIQTISNVFCILDSDYDTSGKPNKIFYSSTMSFPLTVSFFFLHIFTINLSQKLRASLLGVREALNKVVVTIANFTLSKVSLSLVFFFLFNFIRSFNFFYFLF